MIIKAELKDAKEIFNLEKTWEKEGINYGIYVPKERLEEIKKEIKSQLVYIAIENGKVIGFIQGEIVKAGRMRPTFNINKGEKYGELKEVYVLKNYRGNKIGKLLVYRIFKEFKDKKIKKIILKSTSKNVYRLVNYYKKLGFEERLIDMFKELK